MPLASLTSANTLQSWRLRVNDVITGKLDQASPNTSGLFAHTGRMTISTNLTVTGNTTSGLLTLTGGAGGSQLLMRNGGDFVIYNADNSGSATLYCDTSGVFQSAASISPQATNTWDLGSSSLRWRNIYTQDLHLSNGIGDYTVVEGEEDLFLVNNKNGKTFKFALIEVSPSEIPPKSKT
jgi:hypothetical protein